jgi:hypothetical protein
VHDGDRGTYTRRNMSKLKSYVAASDKDGPAGKFIELQELFARRKKLLARNLQVRRLLSGRDDNKMRFQDLVSNLNGIWPNEMRAAVERHDARLCDAWGRAA